MASSEGGVGIDLASAAAGEKGTRGKFFRKALKGAVEGRYEDTKAEDRVAACQSGKFEIAVSETTLSGNASKLKVTFDSKGGYAQSATCAVNMKRTGPEYTCDDSQPVSGKTYEIKKVEQDRIVYLKLPPAGDQFEVSFPPDKPGVIHFKMWAGMGDQVVLKKAE